MYFILIGGAKGMDTTFELVRATKSMFAGRRESFRDIYDIALDDIYFQLQFVMCDEQNITKEIEKFFVNFSKGIFMTDSAEGIAELLNISVMQKTDEWVREKRREMLVAEERGSYPVPNSASTFLTGETLDDMEYTKALAGFLCNLPEIHRQTAVAFYYDNLSQDAIVDSLMIDSVVLKNRIAYIEKVLSDNLREYCKERHCAMTNVNSQRIRTALFELSKLYKYPYRDELYANIDARR